ncbi:hypothetical protein ABH15_06390 [Methanoculleus taiwanensis]|uniref:Uncharacterized protein n=1 Tax=Methanoculleus taiwanensis TaxID=1550565 RepID=A0A498H0D3_9EURY|nr:hypothetical protein [Methanoculleus taiwanensis]RXE55847.1 hypothetical protein ABH15_06390 [Methanoculleus taiwanensis]
MQKKDAAAITLTAGMLAVAGLMSMLRIEDLRLFTAVALVGFFIIVYVIHPVFSTPRYMRNLYYMVGISVVLFSLAIGLRILEILSW